ncbi:MAG: 50S ribosomal protein L29 [Alphaproteobacteria bacterium]|nr:50S ribosomal protein L29 [Alphaproteobacteria bacterium]
MKAQELKGKSADELKKMLLDMRKEQFNMRFQKAGGQLDNTAQMRTLRRNIARVKTFLTAIAAETKAGKKAA